LSNQSIYKITTTDKGYTFITDLGLEYQAYFIEGGYMLPVPELSAYVRIFGFAVSNTPIKFKYDCKVKNTLFYILKAVITENPQTIISFTCDTTSSLDRHRKITFSQWYNTSHEKSELEKIDKTINGVYGSLLFRTDHPFKEKIYASIPELEDLLFEDK
jgi:hypothetical protein